jgi:4a-hydroxytetrahydrobiopterin dehydratase
MAMEDQELAARMAEAQLWRHGGAGEGSIEREISFEDFRAAITFVDRVAEVAESMNHHPDILLHGWNKVCLTLSTHSAGGLTDRDFELAARIDELL